MLIVEQWLTAWKTASNQMSSELRRNRARLKVFWLLYIRMYLEEKAANLLYFMIKDHPFADGCKRIAASLFLEFLNRNNALFRDGHKVISDGALVAITLMIVESDPKEKDIMTTMVMNLLSVG